jgi:hypothetical protein
MDAHTIRFLSFQKTKACQGKRREGKKGKESRDLGSDFHPLRQTRTIPAEIIPFVS